MGALEGGLCRGDEEVEATPTAVPTRHVAPVPVFVPPPTCHTVPTDVTAPTDEPTVDTVPTGSPTLTPTSNIISSPYPTGAPTVASTSSPTSSPTSGSTPNPTTAPSPVPGPLCSDYVCEEGYRLRSGAETRLGNDRATCCFFEAICQEVATSARCQLGDISNSLVPNPSFEEFSTCPDYFAQTERLVSWIKGTQSSSEFYVGSPTCPDEWYYPDGLNRTAVDGDGFVSLYRNPTWSPNTYYEYIGTCLESPLRANVTYTVSLFVASDLLYVAGVGYGTTTNGHSEILCVPSCGSFPIEGFEYMGDAYEVLGADQPHLGLAPGGPWKPIAFEVTPSQECAAIMVGQGRDVSASDFSGIYMSYDGVNVQEGRTGRCDSNGECLPI